MLNKILRLLIFCLYSQIFMAQVCQSQELDPFDPFDFSAPAIDDVNDDEKSASQLMLEAQTLFADQRLLDGRTKLLKALKKDPKDYRIHLMLAEYYSIHVGHFRLGLKYVLESIRLFEDEFGTAPYATDEVKKLHAQLLYVLSQARLDLDDYKGALKVLDDFAALKYYASWYSGSRAWVLMKLGNLTEAIRIARLGILTGAESGRTLNMLGILLSMTGDRAQSLSVFREAVNYELSLGTLGQPATPLNNAGEVHKEAFSDDDAELSFLKATRMPDGCQHVLPSLNLAMIYLDQINLQLAKQTMDNFESCIAQYPLRNGEEHRALVELIRGRISLRAGNTHDAVEKIANSLQHTQWFGKIGTSQDDLKVAATISLSEAMSAEANVLLFRATSLVGYLSNLKTAASLRLQSWWLARRARQILMNDLSWFEDLDVRHTDSLLEYPLLGSILSDFPSKPILAKIDAQQRQDDRKEAANYYNLYRAELWSRGGDYNLALKTINEVLPILKDKYDDALKLHALLLKLDLLNADTAEYIAVASEIYGLSKASLRNEGLSLPVNIDGEQGELVSYINKVGFRILPNDTEYSIKSGITDGQHYLEFVSKKVGSMVKVSGSGDLRDLANKFSDEVFSIQLK